MSPGAPPIDPLVAACLSPTMTEWGESRASEYRRCQRAYQLRFVAGMQPRPQDQPSEGGSLELEEREHKVDPLALGNLLHACLQYAGQWVLAGNAEPADWRKVIDAWDATHEAEDPALLAEGERLMSAYFSHWGEDNAGWPEEMKIVSVEQEFVRGILPGEEPLTARADAILELNGRIFVADHKSRAAKIPKGRDRWREGQAVRPQFIRLSWMVQKDLKLEEPPPIIVNAIVKTKIPAFDRVTIPITPEAITQWVEETRQAYAEGFTGNRMNYSACAPEIGMRCWAFDWCHGNESARTRLYQLRKGK